jgi:ankyrin repeat protein
MRDVGVDSMLHAADTLVDAASTGPLSVVQWLITCIGVNVSTRNMRGYTALLSASASGRLSIVQWLVGLPSGPACLRDVNARGNSALLLAAAGGHLEVVQWLLGPSGGGVSVVTERNYEQNTALIQATVGGHLNVVQWLLRPVNSATGGGGGGGATMGERNTQGCSSLMLAAYQGHLHLIQWLLRPVAMGGGGACPSESDQHGTTPLHWATRANRIDCVQWLVNHDGSLISETDLRDRTALTHAAERGYLEMVQWLVRVAGDDWVQQPPDTTSLVLTAAARQGKLSILEWVLTNWPHLLYTLSPTEVARYHGNVQLLLLMHDFKVQLVSLGDSLTDSAHDSITWLRYHQYQQAGCLERYLDTNVCSIVLSYTRSTVEAMSRSMARNPPWIGPIPSSSHVDHPCHSSGDGDGGTPWDHCYYPWLRGCRALKCLSSVIRCPCCVQS